uniref:nitroreductase family protein n=4 Tax=Escherichia coli TaxID=562 RepID=UPI001FCD3B5F
MTPTIELICGHRSIRHFTDEPISEAQREAIINSARATSSSSFLQCSSIIRITDKALMNPLMILVKIIKLRWIHILSYDQMVSRKINNQTTRCANSIFYTTLFTNSAPNY